MYGTGTSSLSQLCGETFKVEGITFPWHMRPYADKDHVFITSGAGLDVYYQIDEKIAYIICSRKILPSLHLCAMRDGGGVCETVSYVTADDDDAPVHHHSVVRVVLSPVQAWGSAPGSLGVRGADEDGNTTDVVLPPLNTMHYRTRLDTATIHDSSGPSTTWNVRHIEHSSLSVMASSTADIPSTNYLLGPTGYIDLLKPSKSRSGGCLWDRQILGFGPADQDDRVEAMIVAASPMLHLLRRTLVNVPVKPAHTYISIRDAMSDFVDEDPYACELCATVRGLDDANAASDKFNGSYHRLIQRRSAIAISSFLDGFVHSWEKFFDSHLDGGGKCKCTYVHDDEFYDARSLTPDLEEVPASTRPREGDIDDEPDAKRHKPNPQRFNPELASFSNK